MRAYRAVQKGESIRAAAAAAKFDVPRRILHDEISGRVQFGTHSGPERYLSDTEEAEFVCSSS